MENGWYNFKNTRDDGGAKASPVWIIIIFYFENVAFFHAKLGSDVYLRVDNQCYGDTLQDLTRPLVENHHQPVIHPWVVMGTSSVVLLRQRQ